MEGRYVVKKAYDFIAPMECDDQFCKFIRRMLVPSKVGFFVWRLCLDRLATKWNIQKRGVVQGKELMCGLCNEVVEESNHFFYMCRKVELLKKDRIIEGENFIGVFGFWGASKILVYIINIYSPCDLPSKRALWASLKNLIIEIGGTWCLMGDFNVVRNE